MRILVLATLLLLQSFTCWAQRDFHLGLAPGLTFVRVSGEDKLGQRGLGRGIFAGGSFTWDVHKKWLEGGLGVEVGKMSGLVNIPDTITVRGQVQEVVSESWENFATPYINTSILLTAKRIYSEGKYMYGGLTAGIMATRSGLLYNEQIVSLNFGLRGGMVFYIDDRTGLDLGLSWRRAKMNGRGYDPNNELQPGLPQHVLNYAVLKYVGVHVGIVVHFE